MRGHDMTGMCGVCSSGLSHCRCEHISGNFGAGARDFLLQYSDFATAKAGDVVRVYYVHDSDPDPFSAKHRANPVVSCRATVTHRDGRTFRFKKLDE